MSTVKHEYILVQVAYFGIQGIFSLSSQVSPNQSSFVACIAFVGSQGLLISGGGDATVKLPGPFYLLLQWDSPL